MTRIWMAVVVLLVVPGCVQEEEPSTGRDHDVSGSFTEQATQAQMNELRQYVGDRGGELLVMESFPAQFQARGLTPQGCEEVHAYASQRPYVAGVGDCRAAA